MTLTPRAAAPSSPAVDEVTFSISGVTCEACQSRIEQAIRSVPGVTEAAVDLVTARARVRFTPRVGHRDAVIEAVVRAGYAINPEPGAERSAPQCSALSARMRRFETYLPGTLTRWLAGSSETTRIASVERIATVMFTDIAGFTSLAETEPAGAVADFLNEHFALLAAAIEAHGGALDKFLGDGAMAFWVASEQPDHAVRAARAALDIRQAITRDNVQRRIRGSRPVRVRIGIHTGPVVIGSIGAPSRMAYTIVGDTVNTAQRLEQFGKEIPANDGAEVTVLIGETTAAAIGPEFRTAPVGPVRLRGLQRQIQAFVLGPTVEPVAPPQASSMEPS